MPLPLRKVSPQKDFPPPLPPWPLRFSSRNRVASFSWSHLDYEWLAGFTDREVGLSGFSQIAFTPNYERLQDITLFSVLCDVEPAVFILQRWSQSNHCLDDVGDDDGSFSVLAALCSFVMS